MNTTPSPLSDDARTGPQDLRPETWRYVLARTTRDFGFHDLPDAAASLTYYGVLSIFPALITVVAGFVMFGGGRRAMQTLLDGFEATIQGVSTSGVRDALDELAESSGWVALVVGALLTLWAVSRYIGGFSRALNRIYDVDEGRPFRLIKPEQVLVALCFIVIVGSMAGALVLSGDIADAAASALGIGEPWITVWAIGKWPLLVLLALLLIALLYYATPNVHRTRLRWLSLGALIAFGTLVASSAVFFTWVVGFSNYDRIYRSLAGALIFLIWLWIANLALLFGAEVDAQIERGRQLQSGIAAEEHLQLDPRDDRLAAKRAAIRRDLVEEGRRIRYSSAPRGPGVH
jgi:membrane protein